MGSDGGIGQRLEAHRPGCATSLILAKRRRQRSGQLRTATTSKLPEIAALAALDKLGRGVFLIDAEGIVTFSNRAARAMVARGDGLLLRRRRLEFKSPTAQTEFEHFVAQGSGRRNNSLVLCTAGRSNRCPYRVLVGLLEGDAGYFVFVYEPNGGHKPIPVGVLCSLYRLTLAEAILANELFAGKTLARAAQARGISINTAKSALKSIYSKCNVRSRIELTLLLSLGPRTL